MKQDAKKTDTNQLTSIQKKRQVNLRWNHTRNFQLGLIFSLLFVIFVVETVRVEIKEIPITYTDDSDPEVYVMHNFVIETVKPKVEPVAKADPPKQVRDVIKVVENNALTTTSTSLTTDPPVVEVTPGANLVTTDVSKEDPPQPIYINNVMQIPTFPGCNAGADRAEQLECFTRMTHKFVQRRFDYDIGAEQNLSGKVRIACQFTVGPDGVVTDIKVRTTNEALEREAISVVKKLPQMQPGMHQGKSVPVIFSLPIIFQIQD